MSLSHRVVLALHLTACEGLRGGRDAELSSETLERMPIEILE